MWKRLVIKATQDSNIIDISGDTSGIETGSALYFSNHLYEITATFFEKIKLADVADISIETEALVIPTTASFEDAAKRIRELSETTVANYSTLETFWTALGTVTFKAYDGQTFTVKTARQMIADVDAVEQKVLAAAQKATDLIDTYDEQLGDAYQRVIAARDAAQQSATEAATAVSTATEQATIATTQATTATEQAQIATSKAADASTAVTTTTEQATIATTQATIATEQAQIATSKAAVASTAVITTTKQATIATTQATTAMEQAQIATSKATDASTAVITTTEQATIATTQATTATEQAQIATRKAAEASNAVISATEQATIAATQATTATEQAQRAEDLVDAATGGSLLKDQNLADVQDQAITRQNLNVPSTDEVAEQISGRVSTATKICGKPLTGDVDLTPEDLGLDSDSDTEMRRRLRINSLVGESLLVIK